MTDAFLSWLTRYGVPTSPPPTPIKVRSVRIDRGGYAPDGRYFGVGTSVYSLESDAWGQDYLVRYGGDYQELRRHLSRGYGVAVAR